jgi:hypothetical protein
MTKARFPLYIVSKGRADSRLTSKALEQMNQPYSVVIEECDYTEYAAVIDPKKLSILPEKYKKDYEVMDAFGLTKSTGPGPARNFAWDHALAQGHSHHWVMDDNIRGFYRLHKNKKRTINSGVCFRVMEDFCLRYENIAMAGPQYEAFTPHRTYFPPFILNTRIYSCNLIKNDIPFRWRGRYNEDTDLSLQILKAGLCTVQFYAFLQKKIVTQSLKGGNTAEFYEDSGDKDGQRQRYDSTGTIAKSEMLVKMHPDVARLAWKFNRVHHEVDYGPFRHNQLKLKKGVQLRDILPNEYGMQLRKMKNA